MVIFWIFVAINLPNQGKETVLLYERFFALGETWSKPAGILKYKKENLYCTNLTAICASYVPRTLADSCSSTEEVILSKFVLNILWIDIVGGSKVNQRPGCLIIVIDARCVLC